MSHTTVTLEPTQKCGLVYLPADGYDYVTPTASIATNINIGQPDLEVRALYMYHGASQMAALNENYQFKFKARRLENHYDFRYFRVYLIKSVWWDQHMVPSFTYATRPTLELVHEFNTDAGGRDGTVFREYTIDNSILPLETLKNSYGLCICNFESSTYIYTDSSFGTNITCDYYTPTVTTVTVTGSDIESNIVVNFNAEDHSSFVVDVIKNGSVIATGAGTTGTSYTFSPGSINQIGNVTFRVTVSRDGQTATASQDAILTGNVASITSLEPNGVQQLLTNQIPITLTGVNMGTIDISAVQNGITKWSQHVENNVQSSITWNMVANLFNIGTVTLNATATYIGPYYTSQVSSTSSFVAYGPPAQPVITAESTYATPTPTIYFSCGDQYISYQVEIDGVQKTEVYGSPDKYTFTDLLSNNQPHTFKVRVKNSYNLWSSWSTASFTVSYSELSKPTINAYTSEYGITINFSSEVQANFMSHSVLRSSNGTTWTIVGSNLGRVDDIMDCTCSSGVNYMYKVRAHDIFGGIKDSDISNATCDLSNTILSIPNTGTHIAIKSYWTEDSAYKTVKHNTDTQIFSVCGLSTPKSQRNVVNYKGISLVVAFKTELEYKEFMDLYGEEILLLRTKDGVSMYCNMEIPEEKNIPCYYKAITCEFTEVYYNQGTYEEAKDTAIKYVVDEW